MIFWLFPKIEILQPYDTFTHHTFLIFILSCITLVVFSFFTEPKSDEELKGVIWTKSALGIGDDETGKYGGWKSIKLWWFLMVATIAGLYIWMNSKSNASTWLEAEDLQYSTNSETKPRIQERKEIAPEEKFNLWTGNGQLLLNQAAKISP